MKIYNVILIENDLAFLNTFKSMIAEIPRLNIMHCCSDISDAYKLINDVKPDLIFLDVELNDGNAFDLLAKFKDFQFEIVFTTGYNDYAIQAFEIAALHYLLKPFGIKELEEVIKRLDQKKNNQALIKNLISNVQEKSTKNCKIALKTMEGAQIVGLSEVLYSKADNNYTTFYLKNGQRITVCFSIKKYEDLLFDKDFFRIHQSYLVNLHHIEKIIKSDGGYVVMSDKTSIPISRRRREALQEAVEKLIIW
jgi:two-component system LytT family response regulator